MIDKLDVKGKDRRNFKFIEEDNRGKINQKE
jgi:hypothetical protein